MIWLKEALESKGTKQIWLANQLGVSESLVSMWLSEERTPSDEQEKKIKELLGIAQPQEAEA